MDTETIKEMAESVNNVVLATAKPLNEQITRLKAELEKKVASHNTQVAELHAMANRAREEGRKEGLCEYAWWKDGVQYVGTCGTTLKQALKA